MKKSKAPLWLLGVPFLGIVGGLSLGRFVEMIAPHLTHDERRIAVTLALVAVASFSSTVLGTVWAFVRFVTRVKQMRTDSLSADDHQ
jgi:hypothetical protein